MAYDRFLNGYDRCEDPLCEFMLNETVFFDTEIASNASETMEVQCPSCRETLLISAEVDPITSQAIRVVKRKHE